MSVGGEVEVQWLEEVVIKMIEWADHVPVLSNLVRYIAHSLHHDPWRLFLEFVLFVIFLRFIFGKRYKPKEKSVKLSKKEIDELIDEWQPEPLVPAITHRTSRDINSAPIIEGPVGLIVKINGQEKINFATYNFLGLVGNPQIEQVAQNVLKNYGVGSCGPPGFYGTIDVHMELEQKLAKFFGTKEAILYSFGFSTIASTIPAFAKRGDILVCDDGIDFSLQKGVIVSRANIKYYKHNDMEDLERVLKEICDKSKKDKKPLTRRFIVAEGLYQNYGDICNLPKIIELKYKYKFRLILDETYSFGVLGKSGKGVTDHFNVPISKIDILTGSLSTSMAAAGGFCVGATPVIDHQRLSGQGYCFSASMPAMLAASAIEGLKIMESQPDRLVKLNQNAVAFKKMLTNIEGLEIVGDENSPIILARLKKRLDDREKEEDVLQAIVDKALEMGVLFSRAKYVIEEEIKAPIPNIRITVSQAHDQSHMAKAAEALRQAAQDVLKE